MYGGPRVFLNLTMALQQQTDVIINKKQLQVYNSLLKYSLPDTNIGIELNTLASSGLNVN